MKKLLAIASIGVVSLGSTFSLFADENETSSCYEILLNLEKRFGINFNDHQHSLARSLAGTSESKSFCQELERLNASSWFPPSGEDKELVGSLRNAVIKLSAKNTKLESEVLVLRRELDQLKKVLKNSKLEELPKTD